MDGTGVRCAPRQREMEYLDAHLAFLATVGSVSPIGLLGTVWGIMAAFRELANVQRATLAHVAPGIAGALIAPPLACLPLSCSRSIQLLLIGRSIVCLLASRHSWKSSPHPPAARWKQLVSDGATTVPGPCITCVPPRSHPQLRLCFMLPRRRGFQDGVWHRYCGDVRWPSIPGAKVTGSWLRSTSCPST
jgi:hypothetical protein